MAVTIPKAYLEELNLKEGGLVEVKKRGQELIVTSKIRTVAAGVDPKFAHMVDEFINDHEDVLRELSQK